MTDDLELGTIREHYARITPVMEELADVDGNLTIGLNDYSGWYVRRDQDDFELIEEGYDQEARCATLATDYATVQGGSNAPSTRSRRTSRGTPSWTGSRVRSKTERRNGGPVARRPGTEISVA